MSESADLIAGRYRLAVQIGAGGMGVVWRARDELLGRTVALKQLAVPAGISLGRGDEETRRAMREARIAARLQHPNVIGIYDVVEHEGRPFLVMEYLASRSLSQLIAAGELLSPAEAGRIGAQLAAALTAAHTAGIVHRDVKPGNVLIGDDGSVKLTDFGISRAIGDTTVTASGILLGTLGYIAPETAQGQHADARADVYALGATLYAGVEGHAPFGDDGGNPVALMYRIVHEPIIPMQHAGPLEPVLLWMLQRDPALRPAIPQAQRALETIANERTPAESETLPIVADAIPTPPPTTPAPAPLDADASPTPGANATSGTKATPSTNANGGVVVANDAIASDPNNTGTSTAAPDHPRERRTRRAAIGAAIAAVLLGLAGWGIATALDRGSGSPAAVSNTPTAHGAPFTGAASAHASSHPATATTPASVRTSAPAAASSAPPASPTPSAPASQGVADQLSSAIVSYYKLMPNNLDQGWPYMTADYQQNHAGGRSGYQQFWSQIQSVSLSDVTARPPSSVTATIHYVNKDGTTTVERTLFGMVFRDGHWKINTSSVVG